MAKVAAKALRRFGVNRLAVPGNVLGKLLIFQSSYHCEEAL